MPAAFYAYKMKVYPNDWFACFCDCETGKFIHIHNDADALRDMVSSPDCFCGFGSKQYDNRIIQTILNGSENNKVYEYSNYLYGLTETYDNKKVWSHKYNSNLVNLDETFHTTDLHDDMSNGNLSLAAICGHLGKDISPLPETSADPDAVFSKLNNYVSGLRDLFHLRQEYIDNKYNIYKEILNLSSGSVGSDTPRMDALKGLQYTNAVLASIYLGADKDIQLPNAHFEFPSVLRKEYVPSEVMDFFGEYIRKQDISEETASEYLKNGLNIRLGDCDIKMSYGAVHGAIENYDSRNNASDVIVLNRDVASYFPMTTVNYGYLSRKVKDPQIFTNLVHQRLEAKASGNKGRANLLKPIINATNGAMNNKNNALYDPYNYGRVVITAQLFIIELANHLVKDVPDLRIVQMNTDAICVEIKREHIDKANEIFDEWQNRTGYTLDSDVFTTFIQDNVNDYIAQASSGKCKIKGKLSRGYVVSPFNINYNDTIVIDAVREYFINGTPVEQTIGECKDLSKFAIIQSSKNGTWEKDNTLISVPDYNRIYATTDTSMGSLKRGGKAIGDIPAHCLVDNENALVTKPFDEVPLDTSYYVDAAYKAIESFLGHSVDIGRSFSVQQVDMSEFLADTPESITAERTIEKENPSMVFSDVEDKINALTEKMDKGLISKDKYDLEIAPLVLDCQEKYRIYSAENGLSSVDSERVKDLYDRSMPSWIGDKEGHDVALFDENGNQLCNKYNRIVLSDYGAFYEFKINKTENLKLYPGEQWDVNAPKPFSFITKGGEKPAKIMYRHEDSEKQPFLKGFCYISVYQAFDEDTLREKSDDPIIRMGLDKYGASSLINELSMPSVPDLEEKDWREGVLAAPCFDADKTFVMKDYETIYIAKLKYENEPVLYVRMVPMANPKNLTTTSFKKSSSEFSSIATQISEISKEVPSAVCLDKNVNVQVNNALSSYNVNIDTVGRSEV